jgi:hypothetical protein
MNGVSIPSVRILFHEDLYSFNTPVIVVLSKPWQSYSADQQKLLEKILTSVKLDINSIQLVVQQRLELKALLTYSPGRVLIFGSETSEDIAFYQQITAQGFIVIRADDLSALDDQKKKNLWIVLREMFRM